MLRLFLFRINVNAAVLKVFSGLGCAKQDKVFQNNISFGITFK